jgi:8-oxo-dGTP pyrophosphatase MutT (NUDIX family)
MAVTPVDAATVILLRQGHGQVDQAFEVLMALRNSKSAFAPSAYVFPGGRVEEGDYSSEMENFGTRQDLLRLTATLDGITRPERAFGIPFAAIRETFEEVGLLMARRSDGTLLSSSPCDAGKRLASSREMVRSGKMNFSRLLRAEGLTPAFDQLHYFAHWITPELSPLRYDARFFVAAAPLSQQAAHDGEELTGHVWIRPAEALERYRKKKFHMVVPTIVTLEELSRFQTADEVIASTRDKNVTGLLTRLVFKKNEVEEHTPDGRIFRNLLPPG